MVGEERSSYFQYNIELMRTICLWPLETSSALWNTLNTLYIALMGFLLAATSVGQVIEIFVSPNISSMASSVDIMTLTASALFKMVYILMYRKHFERLVDKMDRVFVEKDFIEGTFCMRNWLKNCKVVIQVYVASGFITLFPFFWLAPYVSQYGVFDSLSIKTGSVDVGGMNLPIDNSFNNHDIINNILGNESLTNEKNVNFSSALSNVTTILRGDSLGSVKEYSVKEKKLPLNCWFPIDVTWSPLYEIIYLIEIFPLVGSGHLYLVSDSFFFMIIYLLCGQLEILKISLKGLQQKFDELTTKSDVKDLSRHENGEPSSLWVFYSKDREIEVTMNRIMFQCIDFHVELMDIICDLDRMLRSMIVIDFLHAVISLSFAMLQTIISNGVLEWVQMLLFIGVCVLHQFLNNFFSELLVHQQASVGDAAYTGVPWEGVASLRVPVSMVMAQARHPVRLSGWKMYILGLGTFIEFMKLLASYFLVLQSLHADESKV